MMIDRDGRVWIGCYKGIFYFDKKSKKFVKADREKLPDTMDDAVVNTLMEDRNGNVWAARWGSLTMSSKKGKKLTWC